MRYKVPVYVTMLLGFTSLAAQQADFDGLAMLQSLPTKGYNFGWWTPLASAPSVLHWRFALELGDLGSNFRASLAEAAAITQIANYVGSSDQRVSLGIPRPLGPGLYEGELRAIPHWSSSVLAYRIHTFPTELGDLRKLFEFARYLKIETIISDGVPERAAFVDFLANEYGIDVALCGPPQAVMDIVAHTGSKVGACLNSVQIAREGMSASQVIADLGERVKVVELQDGTGVQWADLFKSLYDHGVRPSLFVMRAKQQSGMSTVRTVQNSVDMLDDALRPFIADQAARSSTSPSLGRRDETPGQRAQLSSWGGGNSTSWDPATPERRAAIDHALPLKAIVQPKRPRTLLVIDLNLGYPGHTSIPTHNYGIEQLGLKTGAYRAVFDNNLENLKYPGIKRFDAVFLNNTVGPIFEDPQIRSGLLRYVREGGGLGGNHAASHTALDWPEFGQMLGAAGGAEQGAEEKIWLKVDDPRSPLNAGFNGKALLYQDQLFRFTGRTYNRDALHVLLSVDVRETDMFQIDRMDMSKQELTSLHPMLGRRDASYAVSWIRNYGRGRVFYTVLGHDPAMFATPEIARHMLGGIQYILGDLRADATPNGHASGPAPQKAQTTH